MATVRPFRAVRPAADLAAKVVSLPYDVMNRKEAAAMAEGNPFSFLHICRSEIDLPELEDPYDRRVYEKARENIHRFLAAGTFLQEEEPVFYLYRQEMEGRGQAGIVGCVSVDEYNDDVIKKHEFTRVEKEIDRINHFDVCDANTEPVFLTYRNKAELTALMEKIMERDSVLFDFVSGDGIRHQLWKIDQDEEIQEIRKTFDAIPSLYIADGHHRSASACKVGMKRREENPSWTGEEEFNFFMAVIFPDDQLRVFDYNRVLKDLNGHSTAEFLSLLEKAGFRVELLGGEPVYPEKKHVFTMFLEGSWYRLTLTEERVPDDIIGSLDVSLLQNLVLEPIFGIHDPRTDKRIDFIGGIRGLKELEHRASSDMKVAFAVYPVEISDLFRVSEADQVMPPKSTWFEPKLGSGLFLHLLSDNSEIELK